MPRLILTRRVTWGRGGGIRWGGGCHCGEEGGEGEAEKGAGVEGGGEVHCRGEKTWSCNDMMEVRLLSTRDGDTISQMTI